MDEKERAELEQLSKKDEKEIREMAENWLFLIDDVPKE